MLRINEVRLPLDHSENSLKEAILEQLGIPTEALLHYSVYRRAIDARNRSAISLTYAVDVEIIDEDGLIAVLARKSPRWPNAGHGLPVCCPGPCNIAYATSSHWHGPCGLFAGLVLAQMGFRPIILERGKAVRERTQDTWELWRKGVLNPESNVQFGEGGAGTFSDGKLYSQIKDPRYLGRKVLSEFVKAGAPEEILYVAKPHIGTFRLVGMVENMRKTIEALGGEIRFQQKVVDFEIDDGNIQALHLAGG